MATKEQGIKVLETDTRQTDRLYFGHLLEKHGLIVRERRGWFSFQRQGEPDNVPPIFEVAGFTRAFAFMEGWDRKEDKAN